MRLPPMVQKAIPATIVAIVLIAGLSVVLFSPTDHRSPDFDVPPLAVFDVVDTRCSVANNSVSVALANIGEDAPDRFNTTFFMYATEEGAFGEFGELVEVRELDWQDKEFASAGGAETATFNLQDYSVNKETRYRMEFDFQIRDNETDYVMPFSADCTGE